MSMIKLIARIPPITKTEPKMHLQVNNSSHQWPFAEGIYPACQASMELRFVEARRIDSLIRKR